VLIVADARRLPLCDGCISAVVTSPPYWGLRDYGSADQIGLEGTPEAYVGTLVAVFREVWRVLKADGTAWLNLGDSYAANRAYQVPDSKHIDVGNSKASVVPFGLKSKDLVGIPWMVAFALRADGWYLRSDIIWHKPNPMPESVTDRPTKAHEYLFLLAKSERYYYDADAIKEGGAGRTDLGDMNFGARLDSGAPWRGGEKETLGRNKRTVWTVPTMPYSGAHFATFPEKLIEPCILAGCPVGGLVCDPFIGSGTVGAVAERLGRLWVGTDLSYQPLASARTAQRGLRW